jgi:hypothetical protein
MNTLAERDIQVVLEILALSGLPFTSPRPKEFGKDIPKTAAMPGAAEIETGKIKPFSSCLCPPGTRFTSFLEVL